MVLRHKFKVPLIANFHFFQYYRVYFEPSATIVLDFDNLLQFTLLTSFINKGAFITAYVEFVFFSHFDLFTLVNLAG